MWCVIMCDVVTSRMRWPWPALGCCAREKKVLVYSVSCSNKYVILVIKFGVVLTADTVDILTFYRVTLCTCCTFG